MALIAWPAPITARSSTHRHFERLAGYLSDGKIAIGGRVDPDAVRIEPTVLTDVEPDAAVMPGRDILTDSADT